ncbi:hypothetical protein DIURU_004264 [Diutina rugosa]|uniref:Uncharacterized protein n=1 Tax=Diutina rugosa TaxID=5481 RepID=A0A642UID8_DIURU|nr:uncharacterized protein DIURU_004264 [Diutina rugosa]KAA8899597.1 hypothetical protein DIURU_004264 [Diutina rugosa]
MSGVQYVIPPYVLNTCLGSALLRQLADIDDELAASNVISPSSALYYRDTPPATKPPVFSYDHWIEDIVREKVYHKLVALGILGAEPPPLPSVTSNYLREMLDTVRDKLDSDSDTEDEDYHGNPRSWLSRVSPSHVGEIVDHGASVPKEYAKLVNMPLTELLKHTQCLDTSFSAPPSVVVAPGSKQFPYSLPFSWSPLIPAKSLEQLHRDFHLRTHLDNGYSTIEMHTNHPPPERNDQRHDTDPNLLRYYNFICDKDINPSVGIFYYEVEVEQATAEVTNFKPLVSMDDPSVSSNQTLHMCVGFARRQFSLDGSVSASERVDLDSIKHALLAKDRKRSLGGGQTEVLESLLVQKPGDLRGSYALNFQDSVFYNSIKYLDATQRQAMLNINRRIRNTSSEADQGRINLGLPLRTRINEKQSSSKLRVYQTDVVGCGINFIDKSLFFTLNGVMARIITHDELVSSAMAHDNLFATSRRTEAQSSVQMNSVYPILGFEMTENFKNSSEPGEPAVVPTQCKIRTNLGFKEFKFNINNYVKNYKAENDKYIAELEREQDSRAEMSQVAPVEVPPTMSSDNLDDLIKDYLMHEGYIDTFKAFSNDVSGLQSELGTSSDPVPSDTLLLNKSHASNRKLIKQYLDTHQFEMARRFLQLNYPQELASAKGQSLLFQLRLLEFVWLMKEYLRLKLEQAPEAQQAYDEAFKACGDLRSAQADQPERIARVEEVAGLFLVRDSDTLKKHHAGQSAIASFERNLKQLYSHINTLILESSGFERASKLEMMCENVSQNISRLSLDYDDDKFMLVNFERDHMDL